MRGDVQLASGQVGAAIRQRPAKSGEQIFLGDRIASGSNSGMQVLLLDETTFTVGADSQVTIDEFVYDPRSGNGKVAASIGKGVFRFVSGKVAQNEPRNMTVRTPVAVIGVRGTAVWGDIGEDRAIIALAGPGKENNSGDKPGGIDVTSPEGTVKADRPGFGAEVIRGLPPRVIPIPPETAQRVLGALTRRSGGATPPAPNGNPATQSGQSTAVALEDILAGAKVEKAQTFGEVAREIASNEGATPQQASFDDLRLVTGTGSYFVTGVPMSGTGGSGSYNFSLGINYGTRQITSQQYDLFTPYGTMTTVQAGPSFYSTLTGQARFTGSTTINGGPTATANVFFKFLNANGSPASIIQHGVTVTDSSTGTSVSGSGSLPR